MPTRLLEAWAKTKGGAKKGQKKGKKRAKTKATRVQQQFEDFEGGCGS
jgi:hypothetical protein